MDDEDEFYDAADDDEEQLEGEIDELAEVVEQTVADEASDQEKPVPPGQNLATIAAKKAQGPPKIVENLTENVSPPTSPRSADACSSSNHLSSTSAQERGLSKRQSKGKYQVGGFGLGLLQLFFGYCFT